MGIDEQVSDIKKAILVNKMELQNEKALQILINTVLDSIFEVEREVRLDEKSIIDFMVGTGEYGGIGVEIKIKGRRKDIYRQCERYCNSPRIRALVLITNRSIGFPKEINGKPCYVINLGLAWL